MHLGELHSYYFSFQQTWLWSSFLWIPPFKCSLFFAMTSPLEMLGKRPTLQWQMRKWWLGGAAGLFEPFPNLRSEALWRPLLLQRQNTFNNGTTWCINFYLGAHHRNRTVAFLLAIKKRTLALSDFGIEFELDFGQRGPWQLVKRCQQKVEASLSLQGIFGLLRISLKQAWPPPPPSSNGKMHLQIRESLTSQLYKSNVATKKLLKTAVCLITREHTGGLFYSALMNSPKTK